MRLNLFDILVLAAVAIAAVGGYRLGFLARVASWVGLGLGVVLAGWLAPIVMDQFDAGMPETRLLVAVGVFLLVTTIGASLGATLGANVRRLLPPGTGLRQVDRVAGGVVGALGGVLLVWLIVPLVAEVPGTLSRSARNSAIAQAIDRYAPQSPQALQDLRRQISDANFPQVFSRLRPSPSTGPPPGEVALPAAVRTRVAASTVKVSGTACGRILSGSGFSPAADTIVTNAHVVAGVDRPSVLRTDGKRLPATVQVFDPNRDLAVLHVTGLGEDALPVATGDVGEEGAVFGHPQGQDELAIIPARIENKVNAQGLDLYGSKQIRREVLILASALVPGDSGGALVDTGGSVVGVAFAVAPDEPATSYALSSTELRAVLAVPRSGTVDTGSCLRG
ncbi:MAG TPA: MarP family serine protease [Acidimicrobiales bacterium]|nr:MarP family serine protease [Acidimicrobiales bacterium]